MYGPTNPVQQLLALHGARRFVDMEAVARQALISAGNSPILHELLGISLCAQRRFEEALGPLQTAVLQQPSDATFHENLALCQRQLKQHESATVSLRKSLQIRPNSIETLDALGSVLRLLQRFEEAEVVLRQALAIAPRHAPTLCILGNVLSSLGNYVEAETCYREAIERDPKNAVALANFGSLLVNTARTSEAGVAAHAAMQVIGRIGHGGSPEAGDLALVVAKVLSGAQQYAAAAQIYGQVLLSRKLLSDALSAYSTMRQVCAWRVTTETETQCRGHRFSQEELDSISPFASMMMPAVAPTQQLEVARNHSASFGRQIKLLPARAPGPVRDRIRVGYLSGDLCDHAVSRLALPVLENHDRDRFEILAYDYSPPAPDSVRKRVEAAFDRRISLHKLSDSAAAQQIAADFCDIVVDATGWTQRTRSQILRFRPAPVQAQWLGYPGTMGAPWCDYIVADKVLIRTGEEQFYSEKIIRMPFTYQPNGSRPASNEPKARALHGLPDDAVVFCSFNQAYKITPDIFEIWMQLLRHTEHAVLWLLGVSNDVKKTLGHEAENRGVSQNRLVFAPFVSNDQHLERIALADLALDCFPYGSHTTASDALWAGVPLVGLAGETFASRVSASILSAAGLADLVASSLTEYRDLALRYATDRRLLANMKARVFQSRRSPLFDSRRFTRDLEAAYIAIDERRRMGLPPDHISIE